MIRKTTNAYRIFLGKPLGKWKLRKPRRIKEDGIKIHIKEICSEDVLWIQLAQDSVQWRACVNTVMNLRVP
jgi:hypothetical protein